jgi:hypothetical protein
MQANHLPKAHRATGTVKSLQVEVESKISEKVNLCYQKLISFLDIFKRLFKA